MSLPKRRTGRTRTRQLHSSSCGPLGQQNCGNYVGSMFFTGRNKFVECSDLSICHLKKIFSLEVSKGCQHGFDLRSLDLSQPPPPWRLDRQGALARYDILGKDPLLPRWYAQRQSLHVPCGAKALATVVRTLEKVGRLVMKAG